MLEPAKPVLHALSPLRGSYQLLGDLVVESGGRLSDQLLAPLAATLQDRCSFKFTGHLVDLWAYHHGTRIDFSRPAKPTDNAHIETFNGSLRDECLNVHWFATIEEAKMLSEAWRRDYNPVAQHPSFYTVEANRFCWPGCDPAG